MQIEQIKDLLDWTVDYHHQLSKCYKHCATQSDSTRLKMLLDYLSDHEQQLANAINKYEATADARDMNTWCIEYVDKNPVLAHSLCEANLDQHDTRSVVTQTIKIHDELVNLYRYLESRAATDRAKELFNSLVLLEKNEAMRMVRDAERLEDL